MLIESTKLPNCNFIIFNLQRKGYVTIYESEVNTFTILEAHLLWRERKWTIPINNIKKTS